MAGHRTTARAWPALTGLVTGLAACAAPPAVTPSAGSFVSAEDGRAAPMDRMVDDLVTARAIYVGEHHEEAAHHALQLRIVQALHQRDPSLAVGMEMFQQPFQPHLDAWLRGELDEPALLERTEYERRWGYDFAMYRPILEYAREHGLPLVALNAPSELSREVAKRGTGDLPEELQAELPDMDLADEDHRALVMDALAAHGDMDAETLERFYQAQVLWDETMAEAVARTLTAPGAPARMVVLAGAMHVRGGLGIPARAARRGAEPFRIVLPADAREEAPRVAAGDAPPAHWWWQPR